MVSQQALWLYSIIHSGRLGVDRNKGHEIVMKQCDGGDNDDREASREALLLTPILQNVIMTDQPFPPDKKYFLPSQFMSSSA